MLSFQTLQNVIVSFFGFIFNIHKSLKLTGKDLYSYGTTMFVIPLYNREYHKIILGADVHMNNTRYLYSHQDDYQIYHGAQIDLHYLIDQF